MSVPFESLGPGQVGRLVYQVIGQNGPISNPANIRYLSPGDVQSAAGLVTGVPGLDFAMAAGQIANLGLGLANLGVSAAILAKLKKLDDRLQRMESRLDGMDAKLDRVLERVARIDVATAEQNLRSSLRHVISQAVSGDTVDLEVLSTVENDLERLAESLDPGVLGFGLHPGLRLSTDVRDMVSSVCRLLRGARLHVWTLFNNVVAGSPTMVQSEDYFSYAPVPNPGLVVANLTVTRALYESSGLLASGVEANSFFGNDSAKEVIGDLFGDGGIPDVVAQQLFWVGPVESLVAETIAASLDVPSLRDEEQASNEKLDTACETVEGYLAAWSRTDAALLFNLNRECTILHDDASWEALEKTASHFDGRLQSYRTPITVFDPQRAELEMAGSG